MKKFTIFICLCFWALWSAQAQQGTLYVAVKTIALRSSTGFFAAAKGTLALGDAVTVLQTKGAWKEIRSAARSSLSGWLPETSLTSKKIVASSMPSASASELALAGKGFSGDVEQVYREEEGVSFSAVDAMEAREVPEKTLLDFITVGHLAGGE